MMEYRISVIVPVYNKRDYLEQCIDSILLQTYENIELLLVDDGSTDGSGEICDRYADEDERVRVFHQQNGGPTAAVMNGIRQAAGDYYIFIDGDDYVSGDMLYQMAGKLIGVKGEIVCCNHVLEKRKETVPVISPIPPGIYECGRLQKEIKDELLGNECRIIPMSRCMKLCEKSLFEGKEKYYDTTLRMGDDFNLMYPVLLSSKRIVIMENALFYHYRYVEDSIVHRYDADMADNMERWYQAIRRIDIEENAGQGQERLLKEYCYMMIYVMKNELRSLEKNYAERIQEIFMNPQVRERIVNTPLSIRNRTNALLYLGMRYPGKILLGILRMIMKRYDKRKKD